MDILFLRGDGIGPEISSAALSILERVNTEENLRLNIESRDAGLSTLQRLGKTLPLEVSEAAGKADGIVLAPLSTFQYPPREKGGINISAEFRTVLNLYANIRPCRLRGSYENKSAIDLIIVRENTEGFYACRTMYAGTGEFMPDPSTAFALRKVSAQASRKIAVEAFQLASARNRELTVVHKANVLKLSDGLFLDIVRETAKDFPKVKVTELLVDAVAALLVRDPSKFDVLLMTNMFGDILSNEAAELAGGLGMAPSLNIGVERAMAQAAHGSAPDLAGRNIANPSGLILSVAMLLEWLSVRSKRDDLHRAATGMVHAVDKTLGNPANCTADQGGQLNTFEFAGAVIQNYLAE
ncbi:isocitrate/isopropylmalate dehydrogenase family protein [Brenneria goodwinii]|uniref:isocitrate/isopropylmalate dehydrogenase family protein n=1 Tax=Brenneria goodwinii TaxID=1109412 RepID=UPI000EF1A846|nr:isocitrate/isopropylmalate family dehydrogenase [Brenneria goodwinii]MCG8157770.1 isocitrate/isopropylmalate dehydrogenase family protein [Brenneria goodwinii]MCG8161717.1 isocitrate/isopropylmalate dehydrogenase family protein [Brenneria goodwinii]MCG8166649.1 isocitrate/isopropylmalate dehydrogenase family protein [Brenneria goodwinii]MCG8171393.1 isocitrate/isopropylmalate dehydrogenase family protein [Brenneria goodwinii]MCG8175400.1 isocitrate/isopropylmalate dehydrogenase family prote